ncbi:class I SAM-dependent methyltransferase [Sessilibacter sp. MAH2]
MSPILDLIVQRFNQLNTWEKRQSVRIFHGRGGTYAGFEHLTIDWHPRLLIISAYKPLDFDLPSIDEINVLADELSIDTVFYHRRYLTEQAWQCVRGDADADFYAVRDQQRFELSVGRQQNVGFFLDIEPGRHWLEEHGKSKRILNLFAFTCAFSVVGVGVGAAKVVNVDMSRQSLNRGRANHHLNNQDTYNVEFMQEDILKSWGRIRKRGPFDVIIFDPPSFQKGSFVAQRDYRKLIRRIPELASEQCEVLACLNSPELDASFLTDLFSEILPQAELVERLPANPYFPEKDPNQALKLYHYRFVNDQSIDSDPT